MAVTENKGILTYIDAAGNKYLLYPITKADCIDGLDEAIVAKIEEEYGTLEDGVGIQSIAKTSTSGLVDTYTITLTNGVKSTFTVTNGKTPVKGTDYYTDADKTEMVNAVIAALPTTEGVGF